MADGPVEFQFDWTAPQADQGPVLFNAAGNAANSSLSPEGDYIYTSSAFSGSSLPPVARQDVPSPESRPARPIRVNSSSKLYHLPAPVNLKRGDTEVHIEHRFNRALADSAPGNAFGLDFIANVQVGLNHALTDRLSVGASRARFDTLITLNSTVELFTRAESFWNLSAVGGVEGRQNFQGHYSPYLQLASSFDYGRLRGYVVPTMIFNSRRDQDALLIPNPIHPQDNHTFALGLGLDAALSPRLSVAVEYVPRLWGFGGFDPDHPTFSSALKIRSWGHVFSVGLSTSRTFTPSFYGTTSQNRIRDVSLGFNIYRRIRP
jgi:hypothetical protein